MTVSKDFIVPVEFGGSSETDVRRRRSGHSTPAPELPFPYVDTTLTRLGMKMLYFRIFIAFLTSRERRLEAARAPSGCLDTDRVTHSQWLLEQRKSIRLL